MTSEGDENGDLALAEAACQRYLARREHSRQELRVKLRRHGFHPDLVETVIDAQRERGWQSDTRFAEVFSRSRLERGHGPGRICRDLRRRGIASADAPDLTAVDWDAQIMRVHGRKFGERPPASPEDRARRERFLLQRGFSGDQIRRLLHRLRQASDGE